MEKLSLVVTPFEFVPNNVSGIEDNTQEEEYVVFVDLGIDCVLKSTSFLRHKLFETDKYKSMIRNLNDVQRRIFLHTTHLLKTEQTPFYEFATGKAGVGKTQVILSIVQHMLRFYQQLDRYSAEDNWIIVCAPTEQAAFNLRGMTLHDFFTRLAQPSHEDPEVINDDQRYSMYVAVKNLKLIIIDEISMVSSRMFNDLEERLRMVLRTSKPFGGVSVLAVGEFGQLPPKSGNLVFQAP